MAESAHDLRDKVQRLPPIQLAALFHVLLEGDPINQFHDNILCVTAPGHIINRYNVGVGELCNRLGFRIEPAPKIFILSQVTF